MRLYILCLMVAIFNQTKTLGLLRVPNSIHRGNDVFAQQWGAFPTKIIPNKSTVVGGFNWIDWEYLYNLWDTPPKKSNMESLKWSFGRSFSFSSWWLSPPIWKNMRQSNWIISPNFRGENKKYLKPLYPTLSGSSMRAKRAWNLNTVYPEIDGFWHEKLAMSTKLSMAEIRLTTWDVWRFQPSTVARKWLIHVGDEMLPSSCGTLAAEATNSRKNTK